MTPTHRQGTSLLLIAKAFPPVPGGVETYSEEVALAYGRCGIDVLVVTSTGQSPGTVVSTRHPRVRVLNVGPGSQPVVAAKMALALMRLRVSQRFDLVHSTTWRVGALGRLIFRRVPQVVSVHGREVLNFPASAGPVMRRVLRDANLVLSVSYATAALAELAVSPKRLRRSVVRWNGISQETQRAAGSGDRLPTRSNGSIHLLSLARLVPRKNVDGCLRALAAASLPSDVDVVYNVAGRGPELERLTELAAELGIGHMVRFLGYVDDQDVPTLYEQAHVFLHPHTHVGEGNDFEGFGIVIADAMAHGCAVVVGDQGGPADYIDSGENGLLVNGLDTSAITAAIELLVHDAATRTRLASNGRNYALANFSWDKHVLPVVGLATMKSVFTSG